ncbi:ABC-three component system protein, partial [Enterococcus sp. 3H8_DIV0648]|uniref:ABC-three component system protein n=2 Tax=Enterococcus TaxID=1350 RepID=UPI000B721817
MPEDFFENYCISKPSKSAKNPRIKSPYESCKEVIESGQKDSILKKFEIYNYGNKEEKVYCCSFDEIEVKIKSLLEILSEGYASKERVDRAYHCLLGLIDTNIKERHKNIQEKNEEDKVNIKFSDMKAIIDRNHDMPSKEYTLYYMRNKFQHIAAIYTDNILMKEYELGMISHQTIDIFQQSLAQIYDLNEKDFYEFCLKIVPDNEVIGDSVDCELALLSDCLSRQNLENCYFEILKQIQQVIENKKWVFNKRMPDMKNITYLPSTIIDDDSFVKKELLIKRIHNNDNLD